jgi:hypothetical protein
MFAILIGEPVGADEPDEADPEDPEPDGRKEVDAPDAPPPLLLHAAVQPIAARAMTADVRLRRVRRGLSAQTFMFMCLL